jgi:hypothetical protein
MHTKRKKKGFEGREEENGVSCARTRERERERVGWSSQVAK